jgi:hypothetical protein
MLRNIQGVVQHEQTVELPREEKSQTAITASAVEASGIMGSKNVQLSSRFAAYATGSGSQVNYKVIQLIVLGPQQVLSRPAGQQAIETFMTSVRLD